jgi:repressor LexA
MARPPSTSLTAQKRVLDVVLRREHLALPNFISDLVGELSLKAESSLGPTLQRMVRVGVILLQGGGCCRAAAPALSPPRKGVVLRAFPGDQKQRLPWAATSGFGNHSRRPFAGSRSREQSDLEAVSVGRQPRPGDFLLRITGDSMCGDGILEGDLVLLRPNVEVQQGEIAAVLWSESGGECEATLKRVFRKPAQPRKQFRKNFPKYTAGVGPRRVGSGG